LREPSEFGDDWKAPTDYRDRTPTRRDSEIGRQIAQIDFCASHDKAAHTPNGTKRMKLGMAQINTTVGDFEGNLTRVRDALDTAREAKLDLVVFPEQALPGYPAEDLLERRDFVTAAEAALAEVCSMSRGHPSAIIIGTLMPTESERGKPVYNSAVWIVDGSVRHVQHKTLLPTYDVFDEWRYFQPGEAHQVFEYKGRRVGLAICEDVWNDSSYWANRRYEIDPVEKLVEAGADLLLVVSASPFSLGRREFRYRMLDNLCRRWEVDLVYVNLVGGNTSLVFDGSSLALSKTGQLLGCGAPFSEDLTIVDLESPVSVAKTAEDSVAECYEALVLGTRDYLGKTGFKKSVIGLSGGIDSTLTAVIARDAIGAENVIGVSMPSRYSSEGSETDARDLAERLGIEFHRLPIESMFTAALETVKPVFGDRPMDVTEENLQARARGQLLMAISNKLGALLLTTGNKSELAVGYCTLYGDMCGGLAVISDVPKTLVYRVCRYVNRSEEVIPQSVIDKPPSAELRPDQKDSDSLPDYGVLDAILEAYIEEGLGIDAIVEKGFSRNLVRDIVRKVDLNEYKRQQAAPGLRITSKAFGPGRRFPIVQRFEP
jgi:NAD+ synthase (glutamine-hydrolysing)